jgi:hypothetical protein
MKASIKKPRAGAKGKPVLLSGGNPQIAKADGDAPVQAFIAAMPDWKRAIGKRLDALITRHVPNVRKAVKWNSPMDQAHESVGRASVVPRRDRVQRRGVRETREAYFRAGG